MMDVEAKKAVRMPWWRTLATFFVLFGLIVLRYCSYGFHYYPQLDDYIQFHDLVARGTDTLQEVIAAGLLAGRPVATLGDFFVWTPLFSHMFLGVLLISFMYALSGMVLKWVFARHFPVSPIFLVIYGLLPLGLEGTYWMSAASRVVVGLFFAALTLLCFELWCVSGKKRYVPLFSVLMLLAYGCYEQVFLFTAAAVGLMSLFHLSKHPLRALWALMIFVNAVLYFWIVKQFPANVVYEGRMVLLSPTGEQYWNTVVPNVLTQLQAAFWDSSRQLVTKGLARGASLLLESKNYLYALVAMLLSAGLLVLTAMKSRKLRFQQGRAILGLVVGLLLAVVPLTIFFLLDNCWFSYRGTVACFCGLALVADMAVALLFSWIKGYRFIAATMAAILAVLFSVVSVSELHDYRETTLKDQQVTALLAETLSKEGTLYLGIRVGILNLEPSYLADSNASYHEHVQGVTSSNWALHGALEWHAGWDIPEVVPLPRSPMYVHWNMAVMRFSTFDVLYLYDGKNTLTRVNAVPTGDQAYTLLSPTGQYLGRTYEEKSIGYLVLAP